MVTEVDRTKHTVFLMDGATHVNGIAFNPDGTKMFVLQCSSTMVVIFYNEYNLSTPFDISTALMREMLRDVN